MTDSRAVTAERRWTAATGATRYQVYKSTSAGAEVQRPLATVVIGGLISATVKAIGQISGAAIASTLVLVAVFIPMAFFPGSTGGIYRQFSVTLAVSCSPSVGKGLM